MSVEFRPRKMGEYLDIARKRKWLILLPTLAIGMSIAYAVYRLPDIYESVTLIVVKPSTLPSTVVPAVAEETLTRELTSISQPQFAATADGKVRPLPRRAAARRADGTPDRPDAQADQSRSEHQPQRHHERIQYYLSRS